VGEVAVWWVVALVAVVVAAVVIGRQRRKGAAATPDRAADPTGAADHAEPAEAAEPGPPAMVAAEVAAPPEPAAAPVSRAEPVPPAAPPAIVPPPAEAARPQVAAAPAAAAAPRVVERPRAPALPKVARFELREHRRCLIGLERAAPAAWAAASPLASTPVQRELLSDLLVRAAELDGVAAAELVYAVDVPADAALALARGAGAPGLESVPRAAIDATAAANFAAAALALQAARAALPALRAQVGEAKVTVAALHPKLVATTEGRVKSLVQDLARYLREAEENYAGAIRKPVFISRIDSACEQAAAVWQGALTLAANARATIEVQTGAPRFGEVQLEKSLTALRELQGQRRVLDAAARILAGWEQLRLLLGDPAPGGAALLKDVAAALAEAAGLDGRLAAALAASLDAAKAPDYVGKAEFNANRNAARELLGSLAPETLAAPGATVRHAIAALDAGFAGRAAQALLLKVDAAARVVEVREAAGLTSPAAG
jgi:hypothetical protein